MEARFTMTPEAKEFLYGPSGKAEYVVYGPVNIEVELKSGEINRPQEIRERVVRCRDCEHGMGGGNLCSMFAFPLGDGHIIPADVNPDGFCSWGEPREEGA